MAAIPGNRELARGQECGSGGSRTPVHPYQPGEVRSGSLADDQGKKKVSRAPKIPPGTSDKNSPCSRPTLRAESYSRHLLAPHEGCLGLLRFRGQAWCVCFTSEAPSWTLSPGEWTGSREESVAGQGGPSPAPATPCPVRTQKPWPRLVGHLERKSHTVWTHPAKTQFSIHLSGACSSPARPGQAAQALLLHFPARLPTLLGALRVRKLFFRGARSPPFPVGPPHPPQSPSSASRLPPLSLELSVTRSASGFCPQERMQWHREGPAHLARSREQSTGLHAREAFARVTVTTVVLPTSTRRHGICCPGFYETTRTCSALPSLHPQQETDRQV